jgi:hypothetical protein
MLKLPVVGERPDGANWAAGRDLRGWGAGREFLSVRLPLRRVLDPRRVVLDGSVAGAGGRSDKDGAQP